MIACSGDPTKIYTAGKGVLVRSPFDGYEDDMTKKVLPATLLTNDIMAPSQLYPGSGPTDGNPWCPTDDSPWPCETDSETGDNGPWNYAQLAVVIGTKMNKVFYDFENIQSEDWGWGVFYSTDSNAVDKRCHYLEDQQAYDCPGGWIDWGKDFVQVVDKLGAGGYEAGNPQSDIGGGGGAGCHFQDNHIDQTDAYTADGENLVQDRDCQCNYHFRDNWGEWVENLFQNSDMGGNRGASWRFDLAMCWMNNPRDMIKLQNEIWWRRDQWSDKRVPQVSSGKEYWGWNEIPMAHEDVANIENWDAVMVKLPSGTCGANGYYDGLGCFQHKYHAQLERDLDNFVKNGYLALGPDHQDLDAKPSSNVVLVREKQDNSGNYFKEFFCEQWTSPTGKYKIVFDPLAGDNSPGGCYLDTASALAFAV